MVAEEQKRELLEFAVQMARRVGAIHLEWFRRSDLEIGTKSNEFDVVTRADRESEACIVRMVAERYPSHALLGEEGGRRGDVAGDWLWVVDPLDGTTNYSQGLPVFAVSIGLRFRGEPVVGVVYAPWLDELFTAVRRSRSGSAASSVWVRRWLLRDFPMTRTATRTTIPTTSCGSSPMCGGCAASGLRPTTCAAWLPGRWTATGSSRCTSGTSVPAS